LIISLTRAAHLSIAIEAVVIGRNVTKCVKSGANPVFAVPIFHTRVLIITNVASWAVIVFFTSTAMLNSIVTTDRVELWAVVIVNTA
jgi:hypothetical protein